MLSSLEFTEAFVPLNIPSVYTALMLTCASWLTVNFPKLDVTSSCLKHSGLTCLLLNSPQSPIRLGKATLVNEVGLWFLENGSIISKCFLELALLESLSSWGRKSK